MSSRKEEERIEKIIRGLMKLPPNRRCINCNSLGPQYVCTNFWTFVCMTCSGIHREFTHRVKSVSMSKFTFQEVEALQKGGNQRAREVFLEDWDLQRLRLPDSSNVDRVREFIKNVYVDKKYAGGKISEKPPRDMQILRNHVDETRRASSYHSYSQSPPYDYQYEDRRYGKQGAMLTRKPGSDRGNYERKISGFIYSPGHLSEQMYEDRFANDGNGSRVSDYSVSSGGDPFRSGTQSPNFQKDIGFGSPPVQPPRENLTEDAQLWSLETSIKRDVGAIPRPQRTSSSGSFGSFDSNFMSLKSVNSSSVMDVASEPEQSGEIQQHRVSTFPSLLQSSHSGNFNSFDPFEAPSVPLPVTSSASTVDLFQLQAASSVRPADSFQSVSISSASSVNLSQPAQISSLPSLDSPFQTTQEQPPVTLDEKSPEFIVPKNEGWATFDIPRPSTSTQVIQQLTPREMSSSDGDSLGKCNPMLLSNASMKWPSFQTTDAQVPSSSMYTPWDECLHKIQTSTDATSPTSWNAFEDSTGTLPLDKNQQSNKPQFVAQAPSPVVNQYLDLGVSEDFKKERTHKVVSDSGFFVSNVPSHVPPVPSYMPSSVPITGIQSQATDLKSNNPFDLPFDSELESSNMFLNMSSLQAALPNDPLPSSFLGGVTETWFPKNQVTSYISGTPHGGLGYMAGQVPSSQLPNVPTQGHVASIGGNPFA